MTVDVLAGENLSKRFSATQALDDVSLTVTAGEVHAVVGQNGAGKSTLIKILAGVVRPDRGRVTIDGRARRFDTPRDALACGIVLIPQELALVPALSVADNVMLGHLPRRRALGLMPAIDRPALRAAASAALDRLGFTPDLDARVAALPYAEQQLVAIARALSREARVLILDEPTAALEHREVRRLFGVIAALKAQGVAVVYISHRLDEVQEIADRCTVLRDGRAVAVLERAAFDAGVIVRHMTGRDVQPAPERARTALGPPIFESDGIAVRAREVLGVAGLLGSGAAELLHRFFGATLAAPSARVRGIPVVLEDPNAAVRAGVGLVPGERARGLVPDLTVRDNILLPVLDRAGRRGDGLVAGLMEALDIRPRDASRRARELSGGNQQKVIFARWLAAQVAVLLLEEPTQGIDVAAKAHIHRLIRGFAEAGGGVLLASADVNEVLGQSDRVIALRRGRIVAQLDRGERFTEPELRAALGG